MKLGYARGLLFFGKSIRVAPGLLCRLPWGSQVISKMVSFMLMTGLRNQSASATRLVSTSHDSEEPADTRLTAAPSEGLLDLSAQSTENRPEPVVLAQNIGKRNLTLTEFDNGTVELTIDRGEPKNLTLAGGGNKGLAYAGDIEALEEAGAMRGLKTLYGSSAGAMTATMLACGMSAQEMKTALDHLNMKELFGGVVEHGLDAGGLMKSLLPGQDLQAPGDKFEAIMRDLARQSVLRHISNLRHTPGPLASFPHNDDDAHDWRAAPTDDMKNVVTIRDRLANGGNVTFKDLNLLSQFIPEIKQLVVTGVAGDTCGNHELVVFSADTEPDMDIAKAAHISGEFPLVFRPVNHTFGFDEAYRCIDGGVLNNIPGPQTLHPAPEGPIPDKNNIILVFEGDDLNQIRSRDINAQGSLAASAKDFLIADGLSAREAFNHRMLVGNDEIVEVTLRNEFGDFSDMRNGTLNFNIEPKARAAMQRDAKQDMLDHLNWRQANPIKVEFHSLSQALYALDDIQFDEILQNVDELERSDEILEAAKFRREARALVDQLATEVKGLEKNKLSLLPTPFYPGIINCFTKLDRSAKIDSKPDSAKIEYFARLLNGPQRGPVSQLMEALKQSYKKGATLPNFPVADAAVNEGIRRDVKVAATNILRDQIYPARMRHVNTSESNLELLDAAEYLLNQAKTYKDIKNSTKLIAKFYQTSKLSPFGSTTIKNAKTTEKIGGSDLSENPTKVVYRAIETIIVPEMIKNIGSTPIDKFNTEILMKAQACLQNATTAKEVNSALMLIIDHYTDRAAKRSKSVELATKTVERLATPSVDPMAVAQAAIGDIIRPALERNSGSDEIEKFNTHVLNNSLSQLTIAKTSADVEMGLKVLIDNYRPHQPSGIDAAQRARKLLMPAY
jgi:exoenzyme U